MRDRVVYLPTVVTCKRGEYVIRTNFSQLSLFPCDYFLLSKMANNVDLSTTITMYLYLIHLYLNCHLLQDIATTLTIQSSLVPAQLSRLWQPRLKDVILCPDIIP
jgi:hypothetical protein